MKPVRIAMTIFFIILSSLNFHKLLTEGGYRGGKVYVVATTQSVIMQILLIMGLILYLIYLIRAKEHYKLGSNSMLSKKKNKMNLSNRIKVLKTRLKLQKPEIITDPIQKDELVEQDLCGKDLCDLDHSTIKLLSGDLQVFNDYAFRYYILDFIDFYERFGDEEVIEDMFIQAFTPPMRRARAKQFSRDEVKIIIDFLQKNYEDIARITHSKKYKKLKPYEQEEIYIPFKHFEKEIKNAIKFWEKYYKGKNL